MWENFGFCVSPKQEKDIELRYSFLASYFEVLYLLDGIINHSIDQQLIKALGRLSVESNEFRELKRFFQTRQEERFLLKGSAKSLLVRLKPLALNSASGKIPEREAARRALASLLNLVAHVLGGSMSLVRENILGVYGIEDPVDTTTNIDGLFIKGDFPAFDFSNLTVLNSRFENYSKLLASKFHNTKFMYCTFERCFDSNFRSANLNASHIDHSCEIGDLREFLTLSRAGKQEENKIIESEAKKFLHCFFKGDRFIDNRKIHIKFSGKIPGLADNKFDRLIIEKYIIVKRVKEIDTFYEIADNFKPSVRRLLTDNYPDALMKRFFAYIRG